MIEKSLRFGPGERLIGTICLPAEDAPPGSGIGYILFNAGVVHRVGPHRINVRFARRLAKRNITSIRFDLAGVGDSTRPGGEHSFEEQAVIDLRAAMDALGNAARCQKYVLFGFCSGAYHGYATALADRRVAGLLLYDAYEYTTLRAHVNRYLLRIRERGLFAALARWLARVWKERLQALVGGDKGVPQNASVGFIIGKPRKADFASGLELMMQRGITVRIVHSGSDFERYNYSRQLADAFSGFPVIERISSDFFPDLDHVVTSIEGQSEFMRRMEDWTDEIVRLDRQQTGGTPG